MLILETSIKDFYTWMSTAEYDLSLVKIDENLFLMFFPMKIIARQYGVLLVFKEIFSLIWPLYYLQMQKRLILTF